MLKVPANVHKHVSNLIPASLINDVACFVFYDNHPKDERNIDITICTKNGELKEFFQRDLISTINLESVSQPTYIRIIRNNAFGLCYLVSADSELYIITSNDKLDIVKKLNNIDKYDIIDSACIGVGCLKIVKKDDAVPIYFDSKFESIDSSFVTSADNVETLPIINELQKKLVEAKYTTKSNEGTLKEYQSIRQNVTLLSGQNLHPNLNDSVFKDASINITCGLKMKYSTPHVTACNQKLVVILEVINEYYESIEDVHILLQTDIPSIVYNTKLFSKLPSSPYWQENEGRTLRPNQDSVVVAVIELHQIQYSVTSRMDMAGAISYKNGGQEYILPFDDLIVSSLEAMGDQFDALSSNTDHHTILSILTTTQKTEITLRHIKNQDEPDIPLQELLCTHIQMENVCPNVIVYKKSPYHALNGVMMVFLENPWNGKYPVTVYTRSASQVLTLLHCISDAIPSKIIATTHNHKITAKNDELSQYNDHTQPDIINHKEYAKSILIRTTKILEYMDSCLVKMGSSKDPTVQSKMGTNIDLFANGVENFRQFKNVLIEESRRGINSLFTKQEATDSDVMIVD